METNYNLEVNYRLRIPGSLVGSTKVNLVRPEEQELLQELQAIALKHGGYKKGRPLPISKLTASYFEYDSKNKRRIIGWNLRTSRQARAAETQMMRLRLTNRKIDLKASVKYHIEQDDQEESIGEVKNYVGNPIEDAIEAILMGENANDTVSSLLEMSYADYRSKKAKKRIGIGALVGLPVGIVPGAAVGAIYHSAKSDRDKDDWSKKYGKPAKKNK